MMEMFTQLDSLIGSIFALVAVVIIVFVLWIVFFNLAFPVISKKKVNYSVLFKSLKYVYLAVFLTSIVLLGLKLILDINIAEILGYGDWAVSNIETVLVLLIVRSVIHFQKDTDLISSLFAIETIAMLAFSVISITILSGYNSSSFEEGDVAKVESSTACVYAKPYDHSIMLRVNPNDGCQAIGKGRIVEVKSVHPKNNFICVGYNNRNYCMKEYSLSRR